MSRHPSAFRLPLTANAVVGLAAMVVLLSSTPLRALRCGDTVGPGQAVQLDADLGPCDGTGAALTVDSGQLDLGGFSVTCTDQTAKRFDKLAGIVVEGKGSVVRNGQVRGCAPAVAVSGRGHLIERIRASDCDTGFSVGNKAKENRLAGNTAEACGSGFVVFGKRNVLSDNIATQNTGTGGADGCGFWLGMPAKGNELKGNTASGNRYEGPQLASDEAYCGQGFRIQGSHTVVADNVATQNSHDGFLVEGWGNRLEDNEATANGDDGFAILGAHNRATGCRAFLNADYGVLVNEGNDGYAFVGKGSLVSMSIASQNAGGGFRLGRGAVKDVISTENGSAGIVASAGSVIIASESRDNDGDGLVVRCCILGKPAKIRHNVVVGNHGKGIYVKAARKAFIQGNMVSDNGESGIVLDEYRVAEPGDIGGGADKTRAIKNDVFGHVAPFFDIDEQNPGCSNSRWRSNTFGTASQACVR